MLNSIFQKTECNKCSGGEKQLIAFFRTLMAEKQIIILDEPFGALDMKKEEIFTDILLKEKRSVLMVTHNISPEYLKQFDCVIRMEQGKIISVT